VARYEEPREEEEEEAFVMVTSYVTANLVYIPYTLGRSTGLLSILTKAP